MVGVQQHRVPRLDGQARCGQGACQISWLDQLAQPLVRQVQADALGVEHAQRHGVDGLAPVLARHVAQRIHVRTGVLAQLQPVDRGRDHGAVGDAVPLLVGSVDSDLHLG